MTTSNEAKEAVYARFAAQFTGVASDNIVFDNEDIKEPGDAPWVRLVVRHLGRAQNTLGKEGNRRFRAAALVFVQVYTLAGSGTSQSDALVKEASDIFEGTGFSGLSFGSAVPRETGPDGRWYQQLVEIPFDYDEIK